MTKTRFAECLNVSTQEGFPPNRISNNDSLLGTFVARINWERFGVKVPRGVRVYSDQFNVGDELPAANAAYGRKLRAKFLTA